MLLGGICQHGLVAPVIRGYVKPPRGRPSRRPARWQRVPHGAWLYEPCRLPTGQNTHQIARPYSRPDTSRPEQTPRHKRNVRPGFVPTRRMLGANVVLDATRGDAGTAFPCQKYRLRHRSPPSRPGGLRSRYQPTNTQHATGSAAVCSRVKPPAVQRHL